MGNGYVLGLDIGMASVGAALLGNDEIVGLHVRAFNKAETDDKGESLNKVRRESRLARRRIRRRAFRMTRLRRLFHRQGLLNDCETGSFTSAASPWLLRAEGLDRKLTNTEWAAALYHLLKHRGFQSNRKSEAKEDDKVGAMLSGVQENSRLLTSSGYRTIGELVANCEQFSRHKRNKGGSYSHTLSRIDVEDELKKLFKLQRKHGNKYADNEMEQAVHALLMARRPALAGEALLEMVGKCTFETEEYRAPKAGYSAERFIWLGKLNNLRITNSGRLRPLSLAEIEAIKDEPFARTKFTYKQARKALSLNEDEKFTGLAYRLDKDIENTILFEAKAFNKLKKSYSDAGLKLEWQRDQNNSDRLDDLAYAQTVFKEDNAAREWMEKKGIEPEIIEAVLAVSFSDFIRLSNKALKNILPHMEQGMRYDEAVAAVPEYFHHSQKKSHDKSRYLPKLSKDDLTNPVVFRAINQARKLVNAIVKKYGPPSAVHIELARDLSKPRDERNRIEKDQKSYQVAKKKDVDLFIENFGFEPKGLMLVKWRLYREQGGKCAYSLAPLDLNRLNEHGYVEVDHALPFSRSFDNSMNNKVLVLTKENRNKGNQTPYEYLGGATDSPKWQAYESYVTHNKSLRVAKRNRLLKPTFDAEDAGGFRERNLTDTRYACRFFKSFLEEHLELAGENNTNTPVVVAGQLTSLLRARWGLLKVREEGDLHHALDAAVVAACSRSFVKRMADYSKKKELQAVKQTHVDPETGEIVDIETLRKVEDHFPQPWEGFRAELKARLSDNPAESLPSLEGVQSIRVSRAPQRRTLGAAHQDTIRSAKQLGENISSVKTPLTKLTLTKIKKMVGYNDPRNAALVESLEKRLRDFGNKGDKAFAEPFKKPSKNMEKAPLVRSVRLLHTQKSGLKVRNGIANNGDMVRVDVFTKAGKYFLVPVYVSDAAKLELPNRAATANKIEQEWPVMDEDYSFRFSLYPNDWVRIKHKKGIQEGYFGGMDRSTAAIHVWTHDRDRKIGSNGLMRSIGVKQALSFDKFHVDMLGNLYPAQIETRSRQ